MILCNGGVFVHIPKTGGTSIAVALSSRHCAYATRLYGTLSQGHRDYPNGDIHFTPDMSFLDKSIWKFTFVRNPWDRFVSWYTWRGDESAAFEEFLANVLSNGLPQSLQSNYLDAVKFDFIGHTETIKRDWRIVQSKLGVGRLPGKHYRRWVHKRKHYSTYYNPRTIELVGCAESLVINQFGYKFEKQ